jgi:hypothetical protein
VFAVTSRILQVDLLTREFHDLLNDPEEGGGKLIWIDNIPPEKITGMVVLRADR